MASSPESGEGRWERLWRVARNANALGAAAFAGVGVAIESVAFTTIAIINSAQAVASEGLRQIAKNRNRQKQKPSFI